MTQRATLYIDQGIDFYVDLEVFDDLGEPLDISGSEVSSSMRKVYSSTAFGEFDVTVGSKSNNSIELSLDSAVTDTIVPGKYQYDVMMTSTEGVRTKVIEGILFVVPTMTRLG